MNTTGFENAFHYNKLFQQESVGEQKIHSARIRRFLSWRIMIRMILD